MSKRKRKRKGWKTGRLHWPGSPHHEHDEPDVAARLKPLEETEEFKDSPQVEGGKRAADDTIRVDSKSVPMPESFIEDEEREGASIFRLEPVVLFVLLLMLAFIAFVAWQITLMPAKQ
ncbi:MAG TPA: hypothetical protein VN282_17370 [Pyrinomonadaceae bacterium]|nr:hypothetical protein [Pyrinomonadaceae bacterium]